MLSGRRKLPSWVKCPASVAAPLAEVLETWTPKVPDMYTPKQYRDHMDTWKQENPYSDMLDDALDVEESLELEYGIFQKTLMLLPDEVTQKEYPELLRLYRDCKRNTKKIKPLREMLEATWKVNPTFFDYEAERIRPNVGAAYPDSYDLTAKMTENPIQRNPKSLFEHCHWFWDSLSTNLALIRGCVKIYMSLGDSATELEKMQSLVFDDEIYTEAAKGFDRIHFSNVPDYVGMNLFTFMHGTPALKVHEAAFVTFNCLTCPNRWPTAKHYNAESLCLYKEADLARALNVRYVSCEGTTDSRNIGPSMSPMPMVEYSDWKSIIRTPLKFESLISRSDFDHWLYSVYMRLVIPAPRDHGPGVSSIVRSPLNQTAFLRFVLHLKTIGYPSHWMASILTNLLTNNVTTSARPPSKCPISLEEVNQRAPAAAFDTSPWLSELRTLVAQFQRLLPFAVIVENGILPDLDKIREVTLTWTQDFRNTSLKHRC